MKITPQSSSQILKVSDPPQRVPSAQSNASAHFKEAFTNGLTGTFMVAASLARLFHPDTRHVDQFDRAGANAQIGAGAEYGAKLIFGSLGSLAKGVGYGIASLFDRRHEK